MFCVIVPFSEGHHYIYVENEENADQKHRHSAVELKRICVSPSTEQGTSAIALMGVTTLDKSPLPYAPWNRDKKPSSCPLPYLLRLGDIRPHTGP